MEESDFDSFFQTLCGYDCAPASNENQVQPLAPISLPISPSLAASALEIELMTDEDRNSKHYNFIVNNNIIGENHFNDDNNNPEMKGIIVWESKPNRHYKVSIIYLIVSLIIFS
jgi:hypothetical protein